MAKSHIAKSIIIGVFIMLFPLLVKSQIMNHYWSQSYNSISTLLSGAVVGGGAGNASIYYNPAGIVDLEEGNNISIAASIFTLNVYDFRNIMGDGKHINSVNFYVQPQFLSYGVKSPFKKWSFEVAVFNRSKENLTLDYVEGQDFMVSGETFGVDRISTVYSYQNYYSDDWIGFGGGYKYSDKLYFGFSSNLSFSNINYHNNISSTIYPLYADTINGEQNTSVLANNEFSENFAFTDIRIIGKIGMMYKPNKMSFGLNITLPAIKLFSVGKKASRVASENYNVNSNNYGEIDDYYIFDSQKGQQLKTNYKLPLSVSFGGVFELNREKKIFFTIEYFSGLKKYKLVDSQIRSDITTDIVYNKLKNKQWLEFSFSAKPLVNIALGYQWQIKKNLLFMMGLRSDFNNNNSVISERLESKSIMSTYLNLYHATGGIKFSYKSHQLIAGTQISYGRQGKVHQIANIKNSRDIENDNNFPLLGNPSNSAKVNQFSISLFLGATLNFASKN